MVVDPPSDKVWPVVEKKYEQRIGFVDCAGKTEAVIGRSQLGVVAGKTVVFRIEDVEAPRTPRVSLDVLLIRAAGISEYNWAPLYVFSPSQLVVGQFFIATVRFVAVVVLRGWFRLRVEFLCVSIVCGRRRARL